MNEEEGKPRSQARRKAQSHFTSTEQRDTSLKRELELERQRNAAKSARLKALRLARDAAEAEEAAQNPPEAKTALRQTRKRVRRIQPG